MQQGLHTHTAKSFFPGHEPIKITHQHTCLLKLAAAGAEKEKFVVLWQWEDDTGCPVKRMPMEVMECQHME